MRWTRVALASGRVTAHQGNDTVDLRGWIGHTGIETRPRLLREAAVGISAMDGSLTEQRRVSEEGFRIVKLCC